MPGPLDGVKVVELSEIIAAPFAGMLLPDMGAEVVKVEPPWGQGNCMKGKGGKIDVKQRGLV